MACRSQPALPNIDISNYLLNLQQKLSKVPQLSPGPPDAGPTRAREDHRYGSHFTRLRKSATVPPSADRMSSEWYPISQPPMVQAVAGLDTRWVNRGKEIVGGR